MPIFGFFRKKQEQPVQLQSFDISLAGLPEWFEKAMRDELMDKGRESDAMYSGVLESLSDIKKRLDKLDHARMAGSERVHIAANMIKESFVKKNRILLNGMASFCQQGHRADYAYFMSFYDKGTRTIQGLKESTPKQTILLSRYFKREGGELVDSIKRAEELLKRFREFLGTGSGAMGTREKIRDMVGKCNELRKEADGLDARISGIKQESGRLRKSKSALEGEYLKLLKSREWNELNKLSDDIRGVRDELGDTELRISTELSSVKRPLKKLEHSFARAGKMTPMQKNTLHDFVRDPLKAIMSESGEKELQKCLKSLTKQIGSGKLELKDKERLRVDELIERLGGDMPGLKSRHMELRKTLESMEKQLHELSEMSKSKADLEAEIGKTGNDMGRAENELRMAASRKSSIREQLDKNVSEIESVVLEETQKRVIIKV